MQPRVGVEVEDSPLPPLDLEREEEARRSRGERIRHRARPRVLLPLRISSGPRQEVRVLQPRATVATVVVVVEEE